MRGLALTVTQKVGCVRSKHSSAHKSSSNLERTLRIGTGVERSLATCRGCTRKCACLSVLGLCLLRRTLKFCARQVT